MISAYVADLRALMAQLREETGQGLTEYALILFLVAIVAIVALQLLGVQLVSVLNSVAGSI